MKTSDFDYDVPKKAIALMAAVAVVFAWLSCDLLRAKEVLAASMGLPEPAKLLAASPAYDLPLLKGMKVDLDDPLALTMVIDGGDKERVNKRDVALLTNYFLAGVTMPGKDLWVNLSPYENDRIVSDVLSQTDLGKDLLAQDYVLKQFVSSLTYPKGATGKGFWQETLEKVAAELGTTNVPVNTFNKVWIVPGEAEVAEQGTTVLISHAHLNVMLEQDYLALGKANADNAAGKGASSEAAAKINTITENTVREKILPIIEKEVNTGKSFAALRQIYHALILSVWFRQKMIDSFYRHYMDTARSRGIETSEKDAKAEIYGLYSEAFKKGVYDFMAKEKDLGTGKTISRHYFSGGAAMEPEKMSSALTVYDNKEAYDDAKKYVIAHARDGKLTEADVRLDVVSSAVLTDATIDRFDDSYASFKPDVTDVNAAMDAFNAFLVDNPAAVAMAGNIQQQLDDEFKNYDEETQKKKAKRYIALLSEKVYEPMFKSMHEAYAAGNKDALQNDMFVRLIGAMSERGGLLAIRDRYKQGGYTPLFSHHVIAMRQGFVKGFYQSKGAAVEVYGSIGSLDNDIDSSTVASEDSEVPLKAFVELAVSLWGTAQTELLLNHSAFVHMALDRAALDSFDKKYLDEFESAQAFLSGLIEHGGADSEYWRSELANAEKIRSAAEKKERLDDLAYAHRQFDDLTREINAEIATLPNAGGTMNRDEAIARVRLKYIDEWIRFKKIHRDQIEYVHYRKDVKDKGRLMDDLRKEGRVLTRMTFKDSAVTVEGVMLLARIQALSNGAYRSAGAQKAIVENTQLAEGNRNHELYQHLGNVDHLDRIAGWANENYAFFLHQIGHNGTYGFLKAIKYVDRLAASSKAAGINGSHVFKSITGSYMELKDNDYSDKQMFEKFSSVESVADEKALKAIGDRLQAGAFFNAGLLFSKKHVATKSRMDNIVHSRKNMGATASADPAKKKAVLGNAIETMKTVAEVLVEETRHKVYVDKLLRVLPTAEKKQAIMEQFTQDIAGRMTEHKTEFDENVYAAVSEHIARNVGPLYDAMIASHAEGTIDFTKIMPLLRDALVHTTVGQKAEADIVLIERYHKAIMKSFSAFVNATYFAADVEGTNAGTLVGFDGNAAVYELKDGKGNLSGLLRVDLSGDAPVIVRHKAKELVIRPNMFMYDNIVEGQSPMGAGAAMENSSSSHDDMIGSDVADAEADVFTPGMGSSAVANPLGGIDLADIKVKAAPVLGKIAFAAFDAATFGGFTFNVTSLKRIDAQGLAALAG